MFSFNKQYSSKFKFVINKQIINHFGVLVSFILAHPVDASLLPVCKCKILFNMHKPFKNVIKICYSKRQCV